MNKGFQQIGDRVGRIAVVAIERDDNIAGGRREAGFVTPAVTACVFPDHLRAKAAGHFRRPVRGAVIDHQHLVDKIRHAGQYLLHALFFVQARHNYRDRLSLIHSTVSPA